jgi:Arc/MetJ family transcription regulator
LADRPFAQSSNFKTLRTHANVYIVSDLYTLAGCMRTNIEIDDALLSQAMAAAGLTTKRATVEEGLRLLVRIHEQAEALADLRGLGWEGDLDEMREDGPSGPAR